MSDEPIPVVGEDGAVYYVTEAEDGAAVVWTEAGDLVGIYDDDGQELDANEYAIVGADDDTEYDDDDEAEPDGYSDDDGYDELEERLQQLEQQAAQPREVEVAEVPDLDAGVDRALIDADYIEQALDRQLTMDEQRRYLREHMADVAAGITPDPHDIAARLADMGEPLADLDSGHRGQDHEARTAHIVQRLQDNERAENAAAGLDDLTEDEPPAQQDYYDLDDRSERQAYLADAMRGAADASDTYSSSDYEE